MPDSPIRLLLIDDDVDFAGYIETLLVGTKDHSIEVDHVTDYEQARELVAADVHDAYLVDHELGVAHKSGLDLISYGSDVNDKPMIMLTSNTAEDASDKAIALGASDFLNKQHTTIPMLEQVVRNSISRSAFMKMQASARIKKSPLNRDQLTGVCTRTAIERHFEHYLHACKPGQVGVLVYLDVNDFKPVNDYYGHVAGDQVLKLFARRVMESAPPDYVLGRLGGDEFLLTGPVSNDDVFADGTVDKWLGKIHGAVAHPMRIYDVAGEAVAVSISACMGVLRYGAGNKNRDYLIALASRAMYKERSRKRASAD